MKRHNFIDKSKDTEPDIALVKQNMASTGYHKRRVRVYYLRRKASDRFRGKNLVEFRRLRQVLGVGCHPLWTIITVVVGEGQRGGSCDWERRSAVGTGR